MPGPFQTSIISLPSLQTFHIEWRENSGQVQSLLQLLDLPSLRDFKLSGTHSSEFMFESLYQLPCWTRTIPNLESIALSMLDITFATLTFGSIISQCPKLEILELHHCRGFAQTIEFLNRPDQPVEGPFLRHFKLMSWNASMLGDHGKSVLLEMLSRDVSMSTLKDVSLDVSLLSRAQEN